MHSMPRALGHIQGERLGTGESIRQLATFMKICVFFIYLEMVKSTKLTHVGGSCQQQWGSHYYMILRIFLIDGLYSVIWYVDIMQQLCTSKYCNLLHISQND